jgi:flagellar motor component MotA
MKFRDVIINEVGSTTAVNIEHRLNDIKEAVDVIKDDLKYDNDKKDFYRMLDAILSNVEKIHKKLGGGYVYTKPYKPRYR